MLSPFINNYKRGMELYVDNYILTPLMLVSWTQVVELLYSFMQSKVKVH